MAFSFSESNLEQKKKIEELLEFAHEQGLNLPLPARDSGKKEKRVTKAEKSPKRKKPEPNDDDDDDDREFLSAKQAKKKSKKTRLEDRYSIDDIKKYISYEVRKASKHGYFHATLFFGTSGFADAKANMFKGITFWSVEDVKSAINQLGYHLQYIKNSMARIDWY